jgi:hypothetical protein
MGELRIGTVWSQVSCLLLAVRWTTQLTGVAGIVVPANHRPAITRPRMDLPVNPLVESGNPVRLRD